MGNVAAKEILVSPITIEVRLQEKRGLCRPYLATYKEMYICIFVYVSVCIYTHIYIFTHTHTYAENFLELRICHLFQTVTMIAEGP